MNNIFKIFDQNKNNDKIKEEKSEKEPKINVFGIVNDIFKMINNRDEDWKNKLEILLENCTSSDLSFIKYILNHDLAYNNFTRKYLDIFSKTSYGLDDKKYIHWYINFMIFNKLKFPMFMVFYKFGINNNDKKYKEWIMNHYEIDDDELKDIETTMMISSRDIYCAIQN